MTETIYGYVRVSTQEQNEVRQLAAMREFGVAENNIIVEKLSGKDFNRPRYQKLTKNLRPGDTLVVKSIDRLGRNYDEILEQWGTITKTECIYRQKIAAFRQAWKLIDDFICFYNHERIRLKTGVAPLSLRHSA